MKAKVLAKVFFNYLVRVFTALNFLKSNRKMSFVTLLAYDFRYAFNTIESYYEIADEIILGIDKDRISWSGHHFEINMEEIFIFIKRIDSQGKIKVVEDNFHKRSDPASNETEERNILSLRCKPGNWIIQIDSDEILLNPQEFKMWVAKLPKFFGIKATWLTVFKAFPEQGACLLIDGENSGPNIGTTKSNAYTRHRKTNQKYLASPLKILHFSWGREREDLIQKLQNWGHSKDFNTAKFMELYDQINLENYMKFKDIHPIDKTSWPRLKKIAHNKIMDF